MANDPDRRKGRRVPLQLFRIKFDWFFRLFPCETVASCEIFYARRQEIKPISSLMKRLLFGVGHCRADDG